MASAADIEVEEAEASESKAWSWPVRIVAGFAGLILLLLLLVAALVLGLNTGPGRDFVKDQVEALEFENGMSIGIGAIDGSLYDKMTIREFTLSDPQGVFLRIPAAKVDWDPFAFANNHIDITALTAETATLERLPEFAEVPANDDPLLPDYDIDIDRFAIEKFLIKAPVTGEPRTASMSGNVQIADARAKVNFEGAALANLTPGQGAVGGDNIVLRLDAVPDDNVFDLDLDLTAPTGGIIAGLAGLEEPLNAKLSGKGGWDNWNGMLAAKLGEDNLADLSLSGRDGTFAAMGEAALVKFAPASTADLLGEATAIDVSAILDERTAQVDGRFSSDAFTLGTNGLVDLSDNSFDDFKAAFVLLNPSALTPNLRGQSLRAMLTLNGELAAPLVEYDINAARIAVNDIDLVQLSASGETQVDMEGMTIPVAASVARIAGLDTAAGGTLTDITLRGDIAYQDGRLLSDNLRIRSDRIGAGVIMVADLNAGQYGAAIDGKLDNYRLESVGIFNIETDIDLEADSDGDYRLAGKARARSTSLSNESVSEFLGGDFIVTSDIAYGSDGIARFSNARLDAPLLKVTDGRGTYLRSMGESWSWIGLVRIDSCKGWALLPLQVVLAFFAILGTGAGLSIGGEALGLEFMRPDNSGAQERFGDVAGNTQLYVFWLAIVWFAGPAEELYFRGFMIGKLREVLGDSGFATALTILIPAIIFGAGHVYYAGLRGLVTTGGIAVTLGVLYILYKRNIWPLMIAHAAANSLTFTAVYLQLDA